MHKTLQSQGQPWISNKKNKGKSK